MTYIPSAREDEDYNQKYLNKLDKEFIRGFDYALAEAVSIFFDNLEDFDDTYLSHILTQPVPECLKEDYISYHYENGEFIEDRRTVETYADYLRFRLSESCECERDELIVSMIDAMSDEEYEQIRQEVDGEYTDGGDV